MSSRKRGLSVRAKLALSYAAFLMVTSVLLLAVVWVFLLRYVPEEGIFLPYEPYYDEESYLYPSWIPGQSDLWEAFAPKAAWALGFLLALGLVGGWILAGRMLAPLTQIRAATTVATDGTLSHRVRLEGPGTGSATSRTVSMRCSNGWKACSRTAALRGQRLARTARSAGHFADPPGGCPERSESGRESPSPANLLTCPCFWTKQWKPCCPLRKSGVSVFLPMAG